MRREILLSIGALALFLVCWQWGPALLSLPAYILPPFTDVVHEGVRMISTDKLGHHMLMSALAVFIGFTLGSIVGMLCGYLLGMSKTAETVLSPYILALQVAPKVAFAPLFIMWLGYTAYPKILVAVLIVFFPVMINVLSAIRNVDPDLLNLVRSFSASRAQAFWKIEFPASLPSLFAGLRIAATLAVIGITVGEMVGGNTGLGYLLVFGEGQANTSMVFVAIAMLTVIGVAAYMSIVLIERKALSWLPRQPVYQ